MNKTRFKLQNLNTTHSTNESSINLLYYSFWINYDYIITY